ncbi:MAG: hypothetical protein HW402_576 [Dehalococcoidales bacterium]|nr:hypothetical protein [Dehalococcoidales bacterium]
MAEGNGKRRLLHTSDLHLLSLGDNACVGLEALVNLAMKMKVDMVIVAGDLFDHNRVDDKLVGFTVEQLRRMAIETIILPGNHDCLVPGSVYEREELAALWNGAPNVQIMRAAQGETLDFPRLDISVWGKANDSYDNDMRPLAGLPEPDDDRRWHIAVAHGYYSGSEVEPYHGFTISRDEIVSSRQDYIALGHWPVFRCVCSEPVKAYYCDSPSMAGTVNIVDLGGNGVEVTRYTL